MTRIIKRPYIQLVSLEERVVSPPQKSSSFTLALLGGLSVLVGSVTPHDIAEMSSLCTRNFLHAPSYERLEPQARMAFIGVNSAARLRRIIEDPNLIFAPIVRHPMDGRLMGFGLVKSGYHRLTRERVAVGERLHIAPEFVKLGLGRKILKLAEFVSRRDGYTTFVVKASGDTDNFFLSLGYTLIPQITANRGMRDRGLLVPYAYLEKKLI